MSLRKLVLSVLYVLTFQNSMLIVSSVATFYIIKDWDLEFECLELA